MKDWMDGVMLNRTRNVISIGNMWTNGWIIGWSKNIEFFMDVNYGGLLMHSLLVNKRNSRLKQGLERN